MRVRVAAAAAAKGVGGHGSGCGRRTCTKRVGAAPPLRAWPPGADEAGSRAGSCRRRDDGWRQAASGERGVEGASDVRPRPRVWAAVPLPVTAGQWLVTIAPAPAATRLARGYTAVRGGRGGRRAPLWTADDWRWPCRWREALPPPLPPQRHGAAAKPIARGGEATAANGAASVCMAAAPWRHRAAQGAVPMRSRVPPRRRWPRSPQCPVPIPRITCGGRQAVVPFCGCRPYHRGGRRRDHATACATGVEGTPRLLGRHSSGVQRQKPPRGGRDRPGRRSVWQRVGRRHGLWRQRWRPPSSRRWRRRR